MLGALRLTLSTAARTVSVPILEDATQLISESLALERAGETLVIDTGNWTVVYRGSLAGAETALTALEQGTPVPEAGHSVAGCPIEYATRDEDHSAISYSRTIAPLLSEKSSVTVRAA